MSTAVIELLITRAGSLSATHKESALCSHAACVSRPAAALSLIAHMNCAHQHNQADTTGARAAACSDPNIHVNGRTSGWHHAPDFMMCPGVSAKTSAASVQAGKGITAPDRRQQ